MDNSATSSDTVKPSTLWLRHQHQHQHNPPRSSQPTPQLQTPVMHSNSFLGSRSHTFSFSTPRARGRNDSTNPGRTRGGVAPSEVNNAKRGGPLSAGCPRHEDPYFQDEVTQVFERERSRLMEKPGLTLQQGTQDNAIWGEKAGNGIQQHTQYIRRLADLRDELLSQEQTALARALDRLRLDSISNRDAARYRLKMKENSQAACGSDGDGKTIAAGAASRSMMTTVEKFRQMRPQRHAPVILPLQGKQLIETSLVSAASGGRQTGSENATKMESSLRVEESVRSSLQRLIQPTSSIPNIGRKALRQESLELKTQSLHHLRSRVYRSTRHLRPPFITQGDGESVLPPTHPPCDVNVDLSPHVYKLGPMTEGDRINMEKLKQYYYICCLPSTPSSPETDRQSEAMSTPRRGGIRKLRVGSKRNPAAKPARGLARAMVAAAAGDCMETEVWQPRQRHSGEGASSDRVTLPVITRHRESPNNNTHGYPNDYTSDSPGELLAGERKRRQIVIDMPNIIFNAATPESAVESKADRAPLQNAGSLCKTLLQNENRHRELHNLLEDVKDLNKRTETLTSQCTSETC